MLEMLLNSGAASGMFQTALAPEPANVRSGGEFNRDAFSNAGAGWTVATGKASASGSRIGNPMADPDVAAYGPSVLDSPLQAGVSPVMMVALASVALGMILRKRKG